MRVSLALLIFLLILSRVSYSQDEDTTVFPHHFIAFSPFHFAASTFQLSYEYLPGKYKKGIFISPGAIFRQRENESRTGFNLITQLRFYLNKNRIDEFMENFYGLYAAPYFHYRLINDTKEDYDHFSNSYIFKQTTINTYGGGLVMGFQTCFMRLVVLDFYFGGGLQYSAIGNRYPGYYNEFGFLGPGYSGVIPAIGFRGGFAF